MPEEIHIWPGAAPGSEGWGQQEVEEPDELGELRVRNVVVPTLTPILPQAGRANGTAMIVAPCGGYQMLSWQSEGIGPATWLAERGVTCFVLKYRLQDTGPTPEDFGRAMATWWSGLLEGGGLRQLTGPGEIAPSIAPLAAADGAQAVRHVRASAADLAIDPQRIGLLGFSAGAFVATAVALSADLGARPDFVAPIYGGNVEGAVPSDAPPLFTVVAGDDPITFDTTVDTYRAWRDAGRPAELHVYGTGGHGFGTHTLGIPADRWMDRLGDWMQHGGFLR